MTPPPESASGPTRPWSRRPRARLRQLLFTLKSSQQSFMIVAAVLLGVAGGFGAIGFRHAIDYVQGLVWPDPDGGGDGTIARVTAAGPWLRVLVPTVGGLIVGWLVHAFAREAKGHGVPEVMEAVAVRGGVIRPRVAAAKLTASAVTIGTGGSAGREGPIIQIGSAIGSALGQLLRVSSARLKTFVACGASAGMAATFNAPIAAALFSGEIILGNFGAAQFGPIIISSVVGTAVARSAFGNEQTFQIPIEYHFASPYELLPYALLGVFATLVGLLFVSVLHRCEGEFARLRVPEWTKPGLGGLVLGLAALVSPKMMGVGYDLMFSALRGEMGGAIMLALLFTKMLATSVTLGSGGSGGVFAPSLLLGALTGGAVGSLAGYVLPDNLVAAPGAYALVGMGAVVAATTHAPITAIVILFEMTGAYEIILPLMIACTIATLLAMRLRRESIYTIKLSDRGRKIRFGQEVNVLKALDVRGVMKPDQYEVIKEHTPLDELIALMVSSPHAYFYVLDGDERLTGVLSVHDIRKILDVGDVGPLLIAADIAREHVIKVRDTDTLDVVMRHFGRESIDELPVVDAADEWRLMGTVHRRDVMNAYNREMFRRDMAGEIAGDLPHTRVPAVVEIAGGFGLLEVEAPSEFVGSTLGELRVRVRHGVDVLLIRRHADGDREADPVMPEARTVVERLDRLLLFGKVEKLRPFREF